MHGTTMKMQTVYHRGHLIAVSYFHATIITSVRDNPIYFFCVSKSWGGGWGGRGLSGRTSLGMSSNEALDALGQWGAELLTCAEL